MNKSLRSIKKRHGIPNIDLVRAFVGLFALGKTDFDAIDEFIKVTDEDSAHTARELAHTEGIFGGYTSGAVVQAVKQLQKQSVFDESDVVVMIFPDHGSRYMSKVFNDKWMEDQGFMDETLKPSNKSIEYVK